MTIQNWASRQQTERNRPSARDRTQRAPSTEHRAQSKKKKDQSQDVTRANQPRDAESDTKDQERGLGGSCVCGELVALSDRVKSCR
ncbi:hypothetical protein EXIGLDRAFT_717037 [Exidia glandulosa HHB12029]|uniref:Uncharacterized protein n=1 Tax=Exidia glandulosa HHB12029 TaxID=1314781 RepID=A0A165ILJ6_EXIGL|nr:hypothetical protein EXIGLDRAFT_717037 [Exidia glandulosa HHB12029]